MTSSNDTETDNDRPPTPTEEDCCGNACNPCIFDVHKKLLKEWENKKLKKLKETPHKNLLHLTQYSKFIIRDIAESSEDSIFISLHCVSESKDSVLFLNPGQHVILKLSSASKPYTPIAWTQKSLKLLIKLYPSGKASDCIRQLKKDDQVFVRGPYGDFEYQPNSYKNIIMLSIGSGIAAIYPIAVSIVENELEDTKVNMISGFHSFSHVPLKNELRRLSDYWNFECTLCLCHKSTANITGVNVVNSRINKDLIDKIFSTYTPESSLVLICGTPEFNENLERIVKEKEFPHCHVFR
ncbi:hypothetical protein TSAR_001739 [Trichomalopsis sarcophagae]|uniref:FAD-binding FR-type domain-containing protein n=1 Tax=Trichomalopsis sarcophagae TaxID=543379 RepID=A0A232ENP4_9HYME|nr:hypothetical protein TSAR_001739 [Trichomalopsis sarcophagae]